MGPVLPTTGFLLARDSLGCKGVQTIDTDIPSSVGPSTAWYADWPDTSSYSSHLSNLVDFPGDSVFNFAAQIALKVAIAMVPRFGIWGSHPSKSQLPRTQSMH